MGKILDMRQAVGALAPDEVVRMRKARAVNRGQVSDNSCLEPRNLDSTFLENQSV